MPLQIPAGRVSSVREKRIDAGLRLGRIEKEFSLAVFLLDRIVASNCDLSEGLAATSNAITKHRVVNRVGHPRKHCGG